MTENKRFTTRNIINSSYCVWDNDGKEYGNDEVVELLNELAEENTYLKLELDSHKHPLWSTREAERKVSELTELLADEVKKNGELLEENNLLRIENKRLLEHKE